MTRTYTITYRTLRPGAGEFLDTKTLVAEDQADSGYDIGEDTPDKKTKNPGYLRVWVGTTTFYVPRERLISLEMTL